MAGKKRQDGDMRLAVALARGDSVESAARQAGMSDRTAHRRLHDDDFRQLVSEARFTPVRRVAGRLADAGDKAVETMKKLLHYECPKIQLGAAKGILEHLFKVEVADLSEEIAALRHELEEMKKAQPHLSGGNDADRTAGDDGVAAEDDDPGSAGSDEPDPGDDEE